MKYFLLNFFFILFNHLLNAQLYSIDSLELKWERYKLKNGIEVVLQPDTKQTEISVEFWLRTGARDEKPEQFGFAHFFEHATPYGLTGDTNLSKAFRALRTNSNAQTRKDYTKYYVQVKPEGLALALRYTVERLNADTASINDKTIENHRTNVLNEMNRMESSAYNSPTVTTVRAAITFGEGFPYAHSTYGNIENNKSFTTDDVKKWYAKYFFTNNFILFVVGDFMPAQVKSLIEKYFSGLTKTGKLNNVKPQPAKHIQGSFTMPSVIKSNFISITWQIPGYTSPDAEKLELLAQLFDEKIKNDSVKFIPGSGSSELLNIYEWAGQFGVYASFASAPDSLKVEQHLLEIVNETIKNGVSANELLTAKRKMIANISEMEMTLGFIGSRTELLGEGLLYANDPGFYLSRLKRQLAFTAKDIQTIAAKWLAGKGARLLLLSPGQ
jgi:predicted Zn-dependent peptidase